MFGLLFVLVFSFFLGLWVFLGKITDALEQKHRSNTVTLIIQRIKEKLK